MNITRAVKIYYRASDGKLSISHSSCDLLEWLPVKIWLSFEGNVDSSSGLIVNVAHIKKMVKSCLENEDICCKTIYDILLWAGSSFKHYFDNCILRKVKLEYDDHYFSTDTGCIEMLTVTRKYELAAAHRLWNDQWDNDKNYKEFGKCANPNGHGHNYILEVSVKCEKDFANNGYDVEDLDRIVNEFAIDKFDHKNLCLDIPEMKGLIPTVENMSVIVWNMLNDGLVNGKLVNVRIWETQNTYADYSGE